MSTRFDELCDIIVKITNEYTNIQASIQKYQKKYNEEDLNSESNSAYDSYIKKLNEYIQITKKHAEDVNALNIKYADTLTLSEEQNDALIPILNNFKNIINDVRGIDILPDLPVVPSATHKTYDFLPDDGNTYFVSSF